MGKVPNTVVLEGVSVEFLCQHDLRLTEKVNLVRYYNMSLGQVADRGSDGSADRRCTIA